MENQCVFHCLSTVLGSVKTAHCFSVQLKSWFPPSTREPNQFQDKLNPLVWKKLVGYDMNKSTLSCVTENKTGSPERWSLHRVYFISRKWGHDCLQINIICKSSTQEREKTLINKRTKINILYIFLKIYATDCRDREKKRSQLTFQKSVLYIGVWNALEAIDTQRAELFLNKISKHMNIGIEWKLLIATLIWVQW